MTSLGPKYLRMGEVAELLGVAPPTVRWYALQGRLPAYRVGRGSGPGHRRFRYADVAQLGAELGKDLPPWEAPAWPADEPIRRHDAARFLGVSSRFLVDAGYWPGTDAVSAGELDALERQLYPAPSNVGPEEGRMDAMHGMHGMHGMQGRHGGYGPEAGMGRGGRGPGAGYGQGFMSRLDELDALALRSLKRHLEAEKADLEDRLAEVEHRLSRADDG